MNTKNVSILSVIILLSVLPGCNCSEEEKQETSTTSQGSRMNTLPSGLQYEIIKEGAADARTPQKGKQVSVHYTGWLTDEKGQPDMNKKFDSSVDRGAPFNFVIGIGQVIKGWDEGVLGMKVGEKRRLFIPANLGYGARGAGRLIPANANLVFDVELLAV